MAMDDIISHASIPVDIDESNNFLLEVGIRNDKIVIITRFDSLVEPIILTIDAFRRIVALNDDVENILNALSIHERSMIQWNASEELIKAILKNPFVFFTAASMMNTDRMSTVSTDGVDSYRSTDPNDKRFYDETACQVEQATLSRKSYPAVSPANRQYEAWIKRRATFAGWSELATGQSADELASAGFIYEGYGCNVKCPW